MKELEIVIDNNGIEKKIIISSGLISFKNDHESITKKYDVSAVVIAANGDYPPPFEKGSKVLREIRMSSAMEINQWKRVIPLGHNELDFFKFDISIPDLLLLQGEKMENWGLWVCEGRKGDLFPDVFVFNFPLWILTHSLNDLDGSMEKFELLLSQTYRMIMSSLSAFYSFYSRFDGTVLNRCIAFSDIGNNLIDKKLIANLSLDEFEEETVYKLRIRVFTEVLSDWIARSDFFGKAIISYGGGIRTDLIERAWDLQAEQSKDVLEELEDAMNLRNKNLKMLATITASTKSTALKNLCLMSIDTFRSEYPSLSADLIQSRTLVEGICFELCKKNNLDFHGGNLFAYIERLEKSKRVSPWVTSYFHVIRQFGNEVAHYKENTDRRPEMPVGKDLIVIHAALNRILSFLLDERI
jgi:hypothetical protein